LVKQLVPGLLVAAVLAALPGCGRIQASAPAPLQAALTTPNLPMPADLKTAEQVTRAASGLGKDAPLVECMIGVFDKDGQRLDNGEATVVARYARPGGTRPALRTVYLDFRGQPRAMWGPVDERTVYGMHVTFPNAYMDDARDAVPLDPAKLPSARTAIAWALAAGLGGERFFVAYNADRTGPIVAVGRWEEDGDLTHFTASVAFDAQGHRIAAPADEEEDEAS
jgi:hypothetical protein